MESPYHFNMKSSNVIFIMDYIKNAFKTHTLLSAKIFPDDDPELSDDDLSIVVGGMSKEAFSLWRTNTLNNGWKDYDLFKKSY